MNEGALIEFKRKHNIVSITSQQSAPFRTAFQAAVGGCNDCHRATQHAFITIPQEPPQLSIFIFPPAGRERLWPLSLRERV